MENPLQSRVVAMRQQAACDNPKHHLIQEQRLSVVKDAHNELPYMSTMPFVQLGDEGKLVREVLVKRADAHTRQFSDLVGCGQHSMLVKNASCGLKDHVNGIL